jgi:hypothetical protein
MNNEELLSELVGIVPPPAKPIENDVAQRRFSETALGVILPDDYCEIAIRYGSGAFESDDGDIVLAIINPLSRTYCKELHAHTAIIRDRQLSSSLLRKYAVFPQIDGLLPFGNGESSRFFSWMTKRSGIWPIHFFPPDDEPAMKFNQSLVNYLVENFSGRGRGFGAPWDRKWLGSTDIHFQSSGFVQRSDFPDLHMAASAGRADLVRSILEEGGVADELDYERRRPLHHAIQHCSSETVEVLLEFGANASLPDGAGISPIQEAVKFGLDKAGIRSLVEHGASVESSDKFGCSALSRAVMYNNFVAAQLLLQLGADRSTADQSGRIPLDYARGNRRFERLLRLDEKKERGGSS